MKKLAWIAIVSLVLSGCGSAEEMKLPDNQTLLKSTCPERMYTSNPLTSLTDPYSPWDPYQN